MMASEKITTSGRSTNIDTSLIVLKIVLLAIFIGLTNQGGFNRAFEFWLSSNHIGLLVFVGIWTLSLVALVIVAFLPSLWMRLLWLLPITASTFIGVIALEVTKSHLTFYDVVLYWAERANMTNAMEFYADWALIAGAKVLIGMVAFLLPTKFRMPLPSTMLLIPATPIVIIVAMLLVRGGQGTKAFPEQFSSLAMISTLAITDPLGHNIKRSPVSIKPSGPGLARHVFLIMDESLRGDFIDLNKPRGVTPFLASQQDRIANFGYAVAANNCSLFSNLMMRFGAQSADVAGSLRNNPSIWRYVKTAGYKTVYLDAQRDFGELQNAMTVVEREQIDQFEQFADVPRPERDLAIARRLRELAMEPEPSFVYVNKWGNHFPYIRNHPEDAAPFQPVPEGEAMGDNREKLINAYKNSVRWTVDRFFQEFLAGDLQDVAVIYTSDHGQNLLDQDVVMTHCNPSDPHELEGLVPLFVLAGDETLQRRFDEAARINRHRSSHFQIFPTVLELLGFDPDDVHKLFASSLLAPIEGSEVVRAFTYGSVAGPPGVKVRWMSMPDDLMALTDGPLIQ